MLKGRGVDFIKVQSGVPHDAYLAIAQESKRLGIEFEGHVPDAVRAADAVAAGQRTFEHLIGIFEASSPDENKYLASKYLAGKDGPPRKTVGMFLQTFDPAREKTIIQLLATNHVWQCPTLFWERGQWLVDTVDYNKDPDLAYAPRSWVKQWVGSRASILKSLDTDPLSVRVRFVQHELDLVRSCTRRRCRFSPALTRRRVSMCFLEQPTSGARAVRGGWVHAAGSAADGDAQSGEVLRTTE